MRSTSFIKALLLAVISALVSTFDLSGAPPHPPVMEGADEIIYKSVDGIDLKLWVFSPEGDESDAVPAMIFFFGGGWNGGSPEQFVPQSQYLARRGMVGIVADYRVKSRHGVQAKSCVDDARDALRYVTQHAESIGIDPKRIGAGGGSAGGHLAACLGTIYAEDDTAPHAMALYNPGTILVPFDFETTDYGQPPTALAKANQLLESRQSELRNRLGVPPIELSPFHHVTERTPPTIIFHGTNDTTVPFMSAVIFSQRLQANKVNVVMKAYQGSGHGFFNNEPFQSQTTAALDHFLVSLGWLN